MRVALSDACGSYFGNANLKGTVAIYEIDPSDYNDIRSSEDDPNVIAHLVRENGERIDTAFEGEVIPV